MLISATHREDRRPSGALAYAAVLRIDQTEYVLQRGCATREVAQRIARDEQRTILRLIAAFMRQRRAEANQTQSGHQSAPTPERHPAITAYDL